jgi:hypothetical protein
MDYFKLDKKEYALYKNEKEVLLRTGMKFDII